MGATASKTGFLYIKNGTLWKADYSPACRAVMMALDAMELSIIEVDVDMETYEHKSQEITKMNPLQTLPVFKDRELILYDSHAICTYLASRYSGSGLPLYPTDPGGRALVNQLMRYNCGVLYPRYRNAVDPILYQNCNFIMLQQVQDIECSYMDLEKLLGRRTWFGASGPSLGDITIGSTVSTLNTIVPLNQRKQPNLLAWHTRFSQQRFYETANKKGLKDFIQRIGELSQIKQNVL